VVAPRGRHRPFRRPLAINVGDQPKSPEQVYINPSETGIAKGDQQQAAKKDVAQLLQFRASASQRISPAQSCVYRGVSEGAVGKTPALYQGIALAIPQS
jgi:hypothetical protein